MKNLSKVTCLVFALLLVSAGTATAQPPDTSWTRTYGGDDTETFQCGAALSTGDFILAGYTRSWAIYPDDVYILQIDINGDTVWTGTYGGSQFDYF